MTKKLKDYSQVRFNLPDGGQSPVFSTGAEAQDWYNSHYPRGYKVQTTTVNQQPTYQLPEVTVSANAPVDYDELQEARQQIMNGNYYGHKFVPTAANVARYLDLLKKDRQVRNATDSGEWAKFAAGNAVAGLAAVPFATMSLPAAIGTTVGSLAGGVVGEEAGQALHHAFVDPNSTIGEYTAQLWNRNRPTILGHKMPSISSSTGELANLGTWIGGALGGTVSGNYAGLVGKRYRYVHNKYNEGVDLMDDLFEPIVESGREGRPIDSSVAISRSREQPEKFYTRLDERTPLPKMMLGKDVLVGGPISWYNSINPTYSNFRVTSPTLELHLNPRRIKLGEDNFMRAPADPVQKRFLTKGADFLLSRIPENQQISVDSKALTLDRVLQKGTDKQRALYYLFGKTPEIQPTGIKGYSTDIGNVLAKGSKRYGTAEPAYNVRATSTNSFGRSYDKIAQYLPEPDSEQIINFGEMTPEQINIFNAKFGDANNMHIDPTTKTVVPWILTTGFNRTPRPYYKFQYNQQSVFPTAAYQASSNN